MLFNITSSYASSVEENGIENPLTRTTKAISTPIYYSCIHQEYKLSKQGRIYFEAYRYATILEGEYCPTFSNKYEHPENVVKPDLVLWGGLEAPADPMQAHCNVPEPVTPKICDLESSPDGTCGLPPNCSYEHSESDHNCRWGLL